MSQKVSIGIIVIAVISILLNVELLFMKEQTAEQEVKQEETAKVEPEEFVVTDPYKIFTDADEKKYLEYVKQVTSPSNKSISANDKAKIRTATDAYFAENQKRNEAPYPNHIYNIMQQVAKDDAGYNAEAELVRKEFEDKAIQAKKQAEYEAWLESLKPKMSEEGKAIKQRIDDYYGF